MIISKILIPLITLLTSTSVYALTYTLDTPFPTDPSAAAPITANFQYVSPTEVTLSLSAPTSLGSQFVGGWYFNYNNPLSPGQTNYNGNTDASHLTLSFVSGVNISSFSVGPNKADGGGAYAFTLNFSANAFKGGSTSVFDIFTNSGTFNSDLSNFNLLSFPQPGNGQNDFSAAHIQNLADGGSTWIGATTVTTPEPMTYVSLGSLLGLAALLSALRNKKEKPSLLQVNPVGSPNSGQT